MTGAALRAAIYAGRVIRFAPRAESLALCEAARPYATAEALTWGGLQKARAAVAGDRTITELIRGLLASLDLDPREHAIDAARLRAVPHLGHLDPAAAPAYFAHRDTWYANPRAQVNFWVALHDAAPAQTFRLWPEAFGRPLPNDSRAFAWGVTFPRALCEPPGEPKGFDVRRGEVIAFSAAHLHATCANDSGRERFSLDFRAVHAGDRERGLGAPDPDNEAGDAAVEAYALR